MTDFNFFQAQQLVKQQREIGAQIEKLQSRRAALQLKGGGGTLAESRARAQLRADDETLERQVARLEMQRQELGRRIYELAEQRTSLLADRAKLAHEVNQLGEGEARDAALKELAGLLRRVSWFDNDSTLAAEADGILKDIEQRSPWYVVPEDFVRVPSGALIREVELGEHGGVGTVAFGKGTRVLKEVARRNGWL